MKKQVKIYLSQADHDALRRIATANGLNASAMVSALINGADIMAMLANGPAAVANMSTNQIKQLDALVGNGIVKCTGDTVSLVNNGE